MSLSMNGHLRRYRCGNPSSRTTQYAPGGFLAPPCIWRIPEQAPTPEYSDTLLMMLRDGERVHLIDRKGRVYALTLRAGKIHQHSGQTIPHDRLIGAEDGSTVTLSGGAVFVALRPTLAEYIMKMQRDE